METYTDASSPRGINPEIENSKIVDLVNLGFVDRALERARAWVQQEPGDMAYFTCAQCLHFEKHNLAPPSYCINEPSQKELAERR